jgi:flagellar biosynthetic protein FlhB
VSETRTQQASARKLARASAQGDVSVSADLVSAALLGAIGLWASYEASASWTALRALTQQSLSGLAPSAALWLALLRPLAALLAALPVVALLAVLAQRGIAFGTGERGRTASGVGQRLSRAFGSEAWHGFGVALLKACVLGGVLAVALRGSLHGLLDAFTRDASDLLQLSASLGRNLLLRASLALALIGVLDWSYLRMRRARRLRMSLRELLDERRETEGDPLLQRERRARGRTLLAHASLADLEQAALVITAEGRAVALRYDIEADALPSLWIKAEAQLADTLIARAYALSLPVFVDEALAHALSRLEPTEAIPEDTHARVAALLSAAGVGRGTPSP